MDRPRHPVRQPPADLDGHHHPERGLPLPGRRPPAAVRESIGEAAHIAEQLGGTVGKGLIEAASQAYTLAITPAFLVAGLLAVTAAATTWTMIPRDLRPTENH
ncbi:hypothetical protein [Streptomyces sp. KS 21]|uniref:hypothetical protein n=1 Tax=Streptomyces sp. KS 21 TaxID=2485150 RepID=UPI001AAE242F|nr:hypothetical protein [Streptomyces sp. KS 21]